MKLWDITDGQVLCTVVAASKEQAWALEEARAHFDGVPEEELEIYEVAEHQEIRIHTDSAGTILHTAKVWGAIYSCHAPTLICLAED